MIVIYHGKNLATGGPILFPGGSAAVEFFFLVSGVLMARTASKTELQENLGKDTLMFMKHKFSGLVSVGNAFGNVCDLAGYAKM